MNKEEFQSWKALPATKEVFKLLEEEKKEIHDAWEEGTFIFSVELNAKQIGVLEGINKILFMEVEDEE